MSAFVALALLAAGGGLMGVAAFILVVAHGRQERADGGADRLRWRWSK